MRIHERGSRSPSAHGRMAAALLIFLVAGTMASSQAMAAEVFSTDFESGVPPEFSAPGSVIAGVQGYAGLGPPGRQFSGSFLRYTSVPLYPTTLTLRNLAAHDTVDVRFLLGLIDSWDGTELMQIRVDGALLFNHWFQLASGDESSYVPAPGALLSSGTNLGFSSGSYYGRDRAYDMGVEPAFLRIPHTADSLIVTWGTNAVSGPAADQWQGGDDESWAIDQVSVSISSQTLGVIPERVSSRLALAAPRPTPTRGGSLVVHFSLPSGAPATLSLVDVAGRVLSSVEVGSFGAGAHTLDLARSSRLAPGLYFIRLAQHDVSRVTRAVVVN